MSFLYSIFLKLLYPTSVSILLLLASAILRRCSRVTTDYRPLTADLRYPISAPWPLRLSRFCFWSALAILLICGNGWVVKYSTRHLERQYPPLNSQLSTLNSQLPCDVILILSGGILPPTSPRPTVEIAEAGDRLLYGAHLFRQQKAPHIICTGNVATGGLAARPVAEVMADLLGLLGIPTNSIIKEIRSENTHDHGRYLYPILKDRGFKRVILVTSATHMPRSMAVFRKQCPGIEFIPAPTDFRIIDPELPWYREIINLIPTPSAYVQFSETMHEYLGILYYRLRNWV